MKNIPDQNNEQSILEVAERLFLNKGFAMTSTTEIAKEVGCNQAMVHYYFRTKDKLFEAVFEKKAKLFISTLLKIENENLSFEEKLVLKIESHFDMLHANPKLPFLLFNELTTNPQRLAFLKDKIQELGGSVFQKTQLEFEIHAGRIRKMTAIDLLITMLSLNITLFLASPIIKTITNTSDQDFELFVVHRKKENVRIILQSLKP